MTKKLKAFTLVELLAAMAIIAILLGIAGYGISIALRASRDSQREKAVEDLKIGLTDYLGRENEYPVDIGYSNGSFTLPSLNPIITVPVKQGAAEPGSETTSTSTEYRYESSETAGGYILCAKQENGKWFELGTSITETCENGSGNLIQ